MRGVSWIDARHLNDPSPRLGAHSGERSSRLTAGRAQNPLSCSGTWLRLVKDDRVAECVQLPLCEQLGQLQPLICQSARRFHIGAATYACHRSTVAPCKRLPWRSHDHLSTRIVTAQYARFNSFFSSEFSKSTSVQFTNQY